MLIKGSHLVGTPAPNVLLHVAPCSAPSLQWVLIKGGHLVGASVEHNGGAAAEEAAMAAAPPAVVTDVLFDGKNMMEITEPYIRRAD